MELQDFLRAITALPGLSGHEDVVGGAIAEAFEPFVQSVRVDKLKNVIAEMGDAGPRILVAAHQDEIGLVVMDIEEDGSVRFGCSGGVDTRILPAMQVVVDAQQGPLDGVIGAKPPHLLRPEDQKKAVQLKDLHIDLGLTGAQARARVRVGDRVRLVGPLVALADGRLAGKTLDDRACVAGMLEAAKRLHETRVKAQVAFVASTREEVGSYGAQTACWALEPDVAIAIDVTHGPMPGADKWQTFPLEKLAIAIGPNIHPALRARLVETATRNHIAFVDEPCAGVTPTDADPMQISREGVPTLLISVPLKYMHTTVEMLEEATLQELGRLLALFIGDIGRDWEAIKWN
ncbi:MAG: M20/M25/M40 family metallo-hydrolase [Clostridia bacterium]